MTNEEFEQQKSRVRALADRWLRPLGLLWWDIEIVYFSSVPEFRDANGSDAYMVTRADWRYARATISVDCPAIAALNDKRLEWAFVHECCHILTNEVWDALEADAPELHHREHVATVLAKAFVWAREAQS